MPGRLIDGLCGALAALALFALMALTAIDVGGRKFFDHSLPGALELTEILMVVAIFAALPLVSRGEEHVVFDSLDRWLPAAWRRLQRRAVDLVCAAALGGLAWLLAVKAWQLGQYGDTTPQLKLPLAGFVALMGLMCAASAAVHLMHGLLVRRQNGEP